MNESREGRLEEGLRALTTWEDAPTGAWRRALEATRADDAGAATRRLLSTRVPPWALATAAIITIVVVLPMLLLPSLGKARDSANLRNLGEAHGSYVGYAASGGVSSVRPVETPKRAVPGSGLGGGGDDIVHITNGSLSSDYEQAGGYVPSVASPPPPPPAGRHIIRKTTIELATDDVRATFLRATLLVSQARGEFVGESSLAGEGENARADVVLRVAVDRLGIVLNELRELGVVVSEQSSGEDVTTQVVDTEARLRNERRVEQELLELFETRRDAPLDDILELRRNIASVRLRIEQLEMQRARLGQLVSLATVLVLIRAEEQPEEEPEEAGIGAYLAEHLGDAWHNGLLTLADTIAFILRALVGGIIWWILATLVLIALYRHHRVRLARGL